MSDLKISIKIAVLLEEAKTKINELQNLLRAMGSGAGGHLNLTSNADALKLQLQELKNQLNLLNSGGGVNLSSNADALKNQIKELEKELANLGSRSGSINLGGSGQVRNELNGIRSSASDVNSVFSGLKSTLLGLFGVGALIAFGNKLVEAVRVTQDLRIRLQGLTQSSMDYASTDAYLTDLAHRHHKSIQELTDGYSKLLIMEQAGVITITGVQ